MIAASTPTRHAQAMGKVQDWIDRHADLLHALGLEVALDTNADLAETIVVRASYRSPSSGAVYSDGLWLSRRQVLDTRDLSFGLPIFVARLVCEAWAKKSNGNGRASDSEP